MVLAGCTSGGAPESRDPSVEAHATAEASAPEADLLLLGTGSGIAAVDPVTGAVVFERRGAVPAPDRSTLFTARSDGHVTSLDAIDAMTGDVTDSVDLRGDLAIRVVAGDGSAVALMAPLPEGGSPWIPVSRARTTIVVASTSGSEPQRFRLDGNFEPEAFSTDGAYLFLIRYVPAIAPAAYRVAMLELGSGKVLRVNGRSKTASETMAGSRHSQAASGDGARLYTLYTTEPAEYTEAHGAGYSEGYEGWRTHTEEPVAFIHTLAMDENWAFCVGLPEQLWGGRPERQAIAVSPDGSRVFAVDVDRGVLAVMNANNLRVTHLAWVPGLWRLGAGTAQARAGVDAIYIGTGSAVAAIDRSTFALADLWRMERPVTGLGLSADGQDLYVAEGSDLVTIDPATGEETATIAVPSVAPIADVTALAA
jgi:hypothetical protein